MGGGQWQLSSLANQKKEPPKSKTKRETKKQRKNKTKKIEKEKMTMRGLCAVLLVTAFFVALAQADAFTDRINKMKAAGENISAFNFGKPRLIKTSEEDPGEWMLGLEITKLQEEKTGFIDITDVAFPISSLGDAPVPPPLPNQPQQKQLVQSLNAQLSTTSFRVNAEQLSSFYTRYYTTQSGAQAAEWIYNTLNSYKGDRTDIEVQFYNNTWVQSSVIARSLFFLSFAFLFSFSSSSLTLCLPQVPWNCEH